MSYYTSFLSSYVEAFTAYRKAADNWCDFYEKMIWRFERYCATSYPNAESLTQEMVDNWCKQHDAEKNNSRRARIYAVVNMIRYLRQRGKTDVSEPLIPRKERVTFIPHAITEIKLENFFDACDNLPKTPNRIEIRSRSISIPVFFRLLYSSGIRTYEARMLRVADVDLQNGILNIQQSKGRRNQHYVVLQDSMLELMRRYNDAIKTLYPDRTYFFPSPSGKNYTHDWIWKNFGKLWSKGNTSHTTPYAFRHHYAITNINNWLDEGFGFDDKFMYLSKSMGHYDIESTKYYYSLTPGLADILEEKCNADFEDIVPEVEYEEVEQRSSKYRLAHQYISQRIYAISKSAQ